MRARDKEKVWVSATRVAEQGGFDVEYTFWDGERKRVVFLADRYSKTEVDRVAELLLGEKEQRPF